MFDSLPLHPAVVHLPLGIVFLLPLVTILVGVLAVKSVWGKRSVLLLIAFHLLLVGSTYIALETGENEEDRVEKVVSESIIDGHEEKAEVFMIGTSLCLLLVIGLLLVPKAYLLKPGLLVIFAAQLILLFLAYQVGHSGGELVYVHGAARAYTLEKNTSSESIDPNQDKSSNQSQTDDNGSD